MIPHLFRTEYGKIVSVLCRQFGLEQVELAEDIASDTFLAAAQTWPYSGIPPNPAAWLYRVARNKAYNQLQRTALFQEKIAPELMQQAAIWQEDPMQWEGYIKDSQLQMMFAVCHPALPKEAQVGLALRILCGFGIEELAQAFLTSKETINKRLYRAKEKLRQEKVAIAMPGPEAISVRLDAVLSTIYLLFNEGYYSQGGDQLLRKDLCLEAMRLAYLLTGHAATDLPQVNALLSLMCFHASRFDARVDEAGELVLYEDQDTDLWNAELIARGAGYLHRASQGSMLTAYHLEAAIASWHTQKTEGQEKWRHILSLYDQLLQLAYSPVAAWNRVYAFSKLHGKSAAIQEAKKLEPAHNRFFFMLLGELHEGIDDEKARAYFRSALSLSNSIQERMVIERRLAKIVNRE